MSQYVFQLCRRLHVYIVKTGYYEDIMVSKSFSTTAQKGRIFIDPQAVDLLSIPAVLFTYTP